MCADMSFTTLYHYSHDGSDRLNLCVACDTMCLDLDVQANGAGRTG